MPLWTYSFEKWKRVPLWNSQFGQDAYIICNGPSFAKVDTSSLCGYGRVVIGVNNTYPTLRPDFWIGMDTPDCYPSQLLRESFPKIYRGSYGDIETCGGWLKEQPASYFMDISEKYPFLPIKEDMIFSWRKNTLAAAIQFALWLGCPRLHLVGVDLDNSKQDYADDTTLSVAHRHYNHRLHGELAKWLKAVVEHPSCPCWIGSCSENSRINSFMPYLPLVDALKNSESGIVTGRAKGHVLQK